jgi:hypothetical protein
VAATSYMHNFLAYFIIHKYLVKELNETLSYYVSIHAYCFISCIAGCLPILYWEKWQKSALVFCGRNSLCMGQSGHWLVPSDFKGPYLSRDHKSSVVGTKRCVSRPLEVWGKGIRGAASKKVHAVLLVVAYITTQLLLPACYQELHDLSPSATGNCCWTFSDTRTPVTSVKLSAGYRVPIWFEEACFSAACFFVQILRELWLL